MYKRLLFVITLFFGGSCFTAAGNVAKVASVVQRSHTLSTNTKMLLGWQCLKITYGVFIARKTAEKAPKNFPAEIRSLKDFFREVLRRERKDLWCKAEEMIREVVGEFEKPMALISLLETVPWVAPLLYRPHVPRVTAVFRLAQASLCLLHACGLYQKAKIRECNQCREGSSLFLRKQENWCFKCKPRAKTWQTASRADFVSRLIASGSFLYWRFKGA